MNTYLIAAGIMLLLITLNHIIAGERFILIPLLKNKDLPGLIGELGPNIGTSTPMFMRRVIRMSWYVTVTPWIGSALLLFYFAGNPIDSTGVIVLNTLAAIYMATAAVIVLFTRARHLSQFLFVAIAICCWYAAL